MEKNNLVASVIVPVYNEEFFIDSFLESIKSQDIKKDKIEIILVDGYSTDNTLKKIDYFSENNYSMPIKILRNAKRTPASSLNIALSNSQGHFIIRLDVHSKVPTDYLTKTIELIEGHPEACNIGGRTVAKGYDKISSIISRITAHPFVIGNAQFRYADIKTTVDTVFPGVWRKAELLAIGGWDESWVVNEDSELNIRLMKKTKKDILLFPDLEIYYYPRNSIKGIIKQYFRYGYWRVKTANRHPDYIRATNALPIFIMTFFSIALIASMFIGGHFLVVTSGLLLYLIYLIIMSTKVFKSKHIFLIPLFIFIIQSSWGIGNLVGHFRYGFPVKGYINAIKRLIS